MAAMEAVQRRVGYSDLVNMPDDGRRYEIHGGEFVVIPSPLLLHQIVATRVVTRLNDYCRRADGIAVTAPLDIVFDEHDTVRSALLPDLGFDADELLTPLQESAPFRSSRCRAESRRYRLGGAGGGSAGSAPARLGMMQGSGGASLQVPESAPRPGEVVMLLF